MTTPPPQRPPPRGRGGPAPRAGGRSPGTRTRRGRPRPARPPAPAPGGGASASSWGAQTGGNPAPLGGALFEVATGEELAALQSRASERLQQKLISLLSLIPAEFLELFE